MLGHAVAGVYRRAEAALAELAVGGGGGVEALLHEGRLAGGGAAVGERLEALGCLLFGRLEVDSRHDSCVIS